MQINTTINILGSLQDWNLVVQFLESRYKERGDVGEGFQAFTSVKTHKSIQRFEKAITDTLIRFENKEIEALVRSLVDSEKISINSLLLLFWNASFNNHLLSYLNRNVYFPAFYSGRMGIRSEEVVACMMDLKERESEQLGSWTDYTIEKVASKYLTLLRKFGLMEGSQKKTISHPNLDDTMFVLFIYWIHAVEEKANLLLSSWLQYSFLEKQSFIEKLTQKKFARFFRFNYTGDNLQVEPVLPYHTIYNELVNPR